MRTKDIHAVLAREEVLIACRMLSRVREEFRADHVHLVLQFNGTAMTRNSVAQHLSTLKGEGKLVRTLDSSGHSLWRLA